MQSLSDIKVILGSRSPRKRELLSLLVPNTSIEVLPPRDANEASLAELRTVASIEVTLMEIARSKGRDVLEQIATSKPELAGETTFIVTGDTTIVVTDAHAPLALEQPPDDATWSDVVRHWFRNYYAGRTHQAVSAICVQTLAGKCLERLVHTEVTFIDDVEPLLDWYISTGEPRGKAGGYAIQGAGSLFIASVKGSISNVVGLPLEALREMLKL
nr:Maf family protein [uncultured bacterium]